MTLPPFIDTHHHLWDLENNPYPWLVDPIDHFVGDYAAIRKSWLIGDLHQGAKNIPLVKSVHVQAEWDYNADPVGETAWLQSVAADPNSRGMPNAIIGYANLSDPNVENTLARHAEHANWRGIRHMLNWSDDRPNFRFAEAGDLMSDPQWRSGFRLLEKFNGAFEMQIWPWQLQEAAKLANDIPEVQIILGHTAMPIGRSPGELREWRKGIEALGTAPNVSAKISALGMLDQQWTTDSIAPFVLDMIDILGVDRCMFASNFPVDSLFSDYETLWNAYDEITSDFNEVDRVKLFRANAEHNYRI
ncbi:MAG TPA: amidohydrolase family protein [Dehalococcoidia bacterium]|nr:amidohydrolase family protein [Dehalococcoidia bacterium]